MNATAIQTIQGNFSLRAISPLCQPLCLYGILSLIQLHMSARRYSPTADNPGAPLYPKNSEDFLGTPRIKTTLYCLNCSE